MLHFFSSFYFIRIRIIFSSFFRFFKKLHFFFFFQAEDGIRDLYVTGVQTCALPILGLGMDYALLMVSRFREELAKGVDVGDARSEERRVGKECRSRWSPYH